MMAMAVKERFGSASTTTWFFLLLVDALVTAIGVAADPNTEGFISIDCGIADGHSYTDDKTTIPYSSDTDCVDTGINYNISRQYNSDSTAIATQERTLRSFPQGNRSCYTLPAGKDEKYLVRATFLHGNYDGRNVSGDDHILFDLHMGVNLWESVNISSATITHKTEVIAVALADYISICLVNKGSGTPFISSLELRPLKGNLYPNATASVSLVKFIRVNYGEPTDELRFPDDHYDRMWTPSIIPSYWTQIKTSFTVQSRAADLFEVPSPVLQTAVAPVNSTQLQFWWQSPNSQDVRSQFHIYMHFAEIQSLTPGQSRGFTIELDGNNFYGTFTPSYLLSGYVYTTEPFNNYQYNFSLNQTASSTLPPIINALEVYSVIQLTETATDNADVNAIVAIKKQYKVNRNWTGDPCAPKMYMWVGLDCSYSVSDPPRITTVNLSSSGLIGIIDSSFAELKVVKYLDLSYNNLTGPIPIVLAELPSLQFLDLTSNQLNGSIPSGLLIRSQNGSLTLRIEGNPYLCAGGTSCMVTPTSTKKKIATAVIVILCAVLLILLLVVIIIFWRLRKKQGLRSGSFVKPDNEGGTMTVQEHHDGSLQLENRQFTYMELKNITNNFEKVLGKGGFGTVYHGYLEDGSQVAVKMLSQSSSEGTKQFLVEAQHLTRVHHRNLVSLIGYCKDSDSLALVYEYMSQGTLEEHLQGKIQARALSWRQRLQIAVDAALGLEYLHKGCRPPLIHRDVKTANILLSERLEAKIADFGLSKAFPSEVNTHVSTAVMGTPGYLDPEYYTTYQLSEKSDVYSFGVVLLELITGKPPIVRLSGNAHIVQWAHQGLARGNIEDIVDARLQGEYDVNSVWKCADIALKCTSPGSHQRPTMSDVVMQLKESVELETPYDRTENLVTSSELVVGDVRRNSARVPRMLVVGSGPSAR